MKKIILTLLMIIGAISVNAGGLDYYRFKTDGSAYAKQIKESIAGLLSWIEYIKTPDGQETYELHFLSRNKPVTISQGRKFLIKLKDGTILELQATEDSEEKHWIGDKLDGAYKNLGFWGRMAANGDDVVVRDYYFSYSLSEEMVKVILKNNIEKFRIDTDQDVINSKEGERMRVIIQIAYEAIQKAAENNAKKDIYNDF